MTTQTPISTRLTSADRVPFLLVERLAQNEQRIAAINAGLRAGDHDTLDTLDDGIRMLARCLPKGWRTDPALAAAYSAAYTAAEEELVGRGSLSDAIDDFDRSAAPLRRSRFAAAR